MSPERPTTATISREKGGPSIGAPAGTDEHALAVPAGVDGLPGQAHRSPPGDAEWEEVLGALEARLVAWRSALRGVGEFPDDFRWPGDLGACPEHLRARARAILATQRDIEDELAARRAALGALLHGIGTTDRRAPVPLFIDQRS